MSMGSNPSRRGALPYQVLAGVEPVPEGWLVVPGNLQGINLAPRPAIVLPTLADVLDYRPTFTVVALHAPIGVVDTPGEMRPCDAMARRLLGQRAGSAVPAPSRAVMRASTLEEAQRIDPTMDIVRWRSLRKASEAIREVQSWRQRSVWEVHPELAFQQMNGGAPLRYRRGSQHGRRERAELLEAKQAGSDWVLQDRPANVRENKLLDALADLWTARRIMARAITRLSEEPVWDSEGVRMDIVC
jgi:predicted RNase H-like nuclease